MAVLAGLPDWDKTCQIGMCLVGGSTPHSPGLASPLALPRYGVPHDFRRRASSDFSPAGRRQAGWLHCESILPHCFSYGRGSMYRVLSATPPPQGRDKARGAISLSSSRIGLGTLRVGTARNWLAAATVHCITILEWPARLSEALSFAREWAQPAMRLCDCATLRCYSTPTRTRATCMVVADATSSTRVFGSHAQPSGELDDEGFSAASGPKACSCWPESPQTQMVEPGHTSHLPPISVGFYEIRSSRPAPFFLAPLCPPTAARSGLIFQGAASLSPPHGLVAFGNRG